MGAPYSSTSVTNYNSNPPSDDGATTDSNKVKWSTQKTKLTDPLKTAFDTSETNTVAGFGKVMGGAGITSTAVDYTVLSADQSKLIKVTASGKTITTPDATSVGSPFMFAYRNASSGTITIAGNNPGVQQTIDGNNSIIVQPGSGGTLTTDGSNWFHYGRDATLSFSPPSAFKNLSIKVATNTTVTLAADYITVTDGSSFQTLAFSKTIDLGTTGANALDTGTIAIDTWYAIWAIAKSDGTVAAIASTSATAPTMPAGYTYKARVGWVQTIHASATLYGTWQFGRDVQYIVGLAQTTKAPQMITGTSGNMATPTWTAVALARFVPTTASKIRFLLSSFPVANSSTAGGAMVAPNNGYGAFNDQTNPPPVSLALVTAVAGNITLANNVMGEFLLESTNVYYSANTANSVLACLGWTDNI